MSTNNDCVTCSQMNKKHKSSIICAGCQQSFCKGHHQEHRKSIENDFDDLLQQHDILRQNLYNQNNTRSSQTMELLEVIDRWEKETIKNVKETAVATRTRVAKILNEENDKLKDDFNLLADELKTNQSGNDYVERDIQEWSKQFDDFKRKLDLLLTSGNDFLRIEVKRIDWKTVLNIHRRKDIYIKTRLAKIKNNRMINERHLSCVHCHRGFGESCGYNKRFCTSQCLTDCSANCSANYSEDGGGCFHGNCTVLLANGSVKLVKDIRKGDVLKIPNESQATVIFAVKISRKNKGVSMVHFDNGLIITPWHPIRIKNQWTFPRDIGHEIIVKCQEVYNFALDDGHIINVNGIECVTLGHNFKGEVVEHTYYGTNKVLDDLRTIDTADDGFINLSANSIVRSTETELVSGICQQFVPIDIRA